MNEVAMKKLNNEAALFKEAILVALSVVWPAFSNAPSICLDGAY
jgi:hypothetical protein